MTLALIDGDVVAYRSAVVQQRAFNWGDGVTSLSLTGSPQEAIEAAIQLVRVWAKLARCKDIRVLLSGSDNFRKRILPSYKANRGTGKPMVYFQVEDALVDTFASDKVRGLEADDLMGILLTTPKYADAVCVTIDKDLRTVPGLHLNPLKETKAVRVSEAEADYKWLMQTLTGDPVDGYRGIPWVGPKTAEKLLEGSREVATMWPKVVAAYRKAGLTEDDALTQARVARILRRSDYDLTTKDVILWHPTTPLRIPLEPTLLDTTTASPATLLVR